MLYTVFAYAMKAVMALFELLMRPLVFNRSVPEVGREVLDVRYGNTDTRKQALDIFVPRGEAPFPVLAYIHGSGYHTMDKKSCRRVCKVFASKGYLVFNINYRLAPACGFPGQVQDVADAIMWAYEHAGEYGGDKGSVFIGGDSAGAYFASLYAAAAGDPELRSGLGIESAVPASSIKGLLLFYGGFDLETASETRFPFINVLIRGFLGEGWRERPELLALASPARHVTSGFPPCCIFGCGWDQLLPESEMFDRILTDRGVSHRTVIFGRNHPDAFHGFLLVPFSPCSKAAISQSLDFMEHYR